MLNNSTCVVECLFQGIVHPRMNCHHLLSLVLFQSHMIFLVCGMTEDSKNLSAVYVHSITVTGVQTF